MSGAEVVAIAAVASAALAATSTAVQASSQAKAARYNAKVAAQNAEAARRQAEADAMRQVRQNERHLAKRRTAIGASGLSVEGTPLDLLEDLAMEGELDVLGIRQRGLSEARRYSISAAQSRAQARTATTLGVLGTAQKVSQGIVDVTPKVAALDAANPSKKPGLQTSFSGSSPLPNNVA
jgi:hypothetical protein